MNKLEFEPVESARPKSFLRWAGSKRRLIPKLSQFWSTNFSRYIEPFVGSGQLYFSITPDMAILGDTNSDLIDTYMSIKLYPERVFEEISKFIPSKENYYALRAINPKSLSTIERSSRFLCLNRYCFNGLYRTNLKGEFNVPFTSGRTGNLPTLESLLAISKCLANVELVNEDFEPLIRRHVQKNDFIYIDPPYAKANGRIFTQYGPHSFGLNDLQRMADLLHVVDQSGAKFLLSYANCPEAFTFFHEWKTESVQTQRNIAGFAKNRRKESELLFTNI